MFPGDGRAATRWAVAEGRSSPTAALTELGNGEKIMEGGLCLSASAVPFTHPASPFPWQPVLG